MEKMIVVCKGYKPQSSPFTIAAGENWTVADIKAEIKKMTELPTSSQLLIMNNHQTLLSSDHEKVETLHLWEEPLILTFFPKVKPPRTLTLPLHVLKKAQTNWSKLFLQIESTASVLQLKMLIDYVEGIPPSRQDLSALMIPLNQGPLGVPMLDWCKLEDVLPDAVGLCEIFLNEKERSNSVPVKVVVVESSDETVEATFEMDLDHDTVSTLKGEIWRRGFVDRGRSFTLHNIADQDLGANLAFTLSQWGVKANQTLYIYLTLH